MQLTFALIKPHVVTNVCALNHVLQIIKKDFQIVKSKEIIINEELASQFYAEHKGRFFYNRLLTFMCSGPSTALILASKDSIKKWRNIMGPTKVFEAVHSNPDSIRGLYGLSDTRNACHGSDCEESVKREISIFFPEFDYSIQPKYGANVHIRPNYLAADETSSIAAVREFLLNHKFVNKFALFQCTSVFLKEIYILEAIRLNQIAECVFAATRSFKLRWAQDLSMFVKPLNFDPLNRPRRQDWSGELIETGMFYFSNRNIILNEGTFQNDRCQIVEIRPEDSIEIDNFKDLQMANCYLNNLKKYQ